MLTIDFERLDLQPGMTVLDAGCGQGRHSLELLRRGCRVWAVDLNAADLRHSRYLLASVAREDAAKAAAKDAGGEIKDAYMTLGSYDVVVVTEFPDDDAAATFSLAMGSRGNVRLTTLKAFSESDARRIIGSLP